MNRRTSEHSDLYGVTVSFAVSFIPSNTSTSFLTLLFHLLVQGRPVFSHPVCSILCHVFSRLVFLHVSVDICSFSPKLCITQYQIENNVECLLTFVWYFYCNILLFVWVVNETFAHWRQLPGSLWAGVCDYEQIWSPIHAPNFFITLAPGVSVSVYP